MSSATDVMWPDCGSAALAFSKILCYGLTSSPRTYGTMKKEELSHLITDRSVLRELRGVSKHIWKLASGGDGTRGGGSGGGGCKQWQQHCPTAVQGVRPLVPLSLRLPKPMTASLDGVRLCLVILTGACADGPLEMPTPCSATIAWNVPRHSLSNNTRSLTVRRRRQPLLFPGNNILINVRKLWSRTHKLPYMNQQLLARLVYRTFKWLTTQYYHSVMYVLG
jgi:hypothetical protein